MTLPEYITAHHAEPFAWGKNDCVLFAIGWLNIATGKDWLADYPRWDSEKRARRVLKELGGLKDLLDRHLKPINPALARDGDIATRDKSLMLFSGRHIVGPGENGLVFVSRAEAEAAWCV